MDRKRQERTPLLDAIREYVESDPAPFDVPGHKMGRLTTELGDYLGNKLFQADVNAPIGLDNLYHPKGVIKEAEDLFADAYGADEALFSVNGTTGGIMTMIVGTIDAKEKIILPRNVHKSVINALILSGAYPIFVAPDIDQTTGIANGVPTDNYIAAMEANPDAKAVFVINPTYFGVTGDLQEICRAAHERGKIVICDEAHGAHLNFNEAMPLSAMEAGADLSALSVHKTAGSLTQSSAVLVNRARVNFSRIQRVFAMFSSTSPNHVLLASLDAARKKMVFEGRELLDRALALAEEARARIDAIKGFYCFDRSYCDRPGRFDFDLTKLVINVSEVGLSGFDIFRLIRQESNVQLELGEVSEVLAVIGIGTTRRDIDRLVAALKRISDEYYETTETRTIPHFRYEYPELAVRPREAFHAPSKIVLLADSVGEISAESLMVYPPGIPIAIPGEVISADALELVDFYEKSGGVLLSDSPDGYIKVIDQDKWYRGSEMDYDF